MRKFIKWLFTDMQGNRPSLFANIIGLLLIGLLIGLLI